MDIVPIFIVTSMGILVNTLIEKPVESLAGLGLTLIGIPIYFYWKKRDNHAQEQNEPEEPV